MDEIKQIASEGEAPLAVGNACNGSERLLAAFSHTSAIGFAILDRNLRYQAINGSLARINGIPAKAHLDVHIRDLFGEIAEKIGEPACHRVFDRGESCHVEVRNVVLPGRPQSRFSGLTTNFPIKDGTGSVQQVAIVVVEVTQQRKLEEFFRKLASELRHRKAQETFWRARALQDAVEQYHTALSVSLDILLGSHDKSTQLLTQSIAALDQRIVAMGALLSSIGSGFPIGQ